MEIIGYISKSVIKTLNLTLKANTPVFIGESNMEHIKNCHPYEFKLYKINEEYVRVAVKITSGNRCFAKTLHSLSICNAERYIEKGTLKRLDTN